MKISRPREDCWPIDGTQHHDVDPEAIYQDKHIKEFFANNTKTLLVACKGMGKTLLLRSKKKTLEEEGADGILIIPRNREYDEPRLRGSYNPKGMTGLLFWEELWNAAIVFSILTHGSESEDEAAKKTSLLQNSISRLALDASFKHELLEDIREKKEFLPSDYLAKLLECGVGSLKKFTKSSHTVDALSIHFIKSAVCVFIDAFDQTLTDCFPNALDVWRDAQLGLARAAHKMNTKNKHIKIYATIRQEAWSGFENQDREVISGRAFLIEYSERTLQEMFLHAVKRYSKQNSIEDFFGLPTIHNSTCFTNEAPFSYLYRHAVGSARSIIGLGAQLDQEDLLSLPSSEREQQTKQLINRAASENVFKDYVLGQRKMFLEALKDEVRLRKLLSLLPSNVLTGKSLKTIHHRFCEQVAIDPDENHPFCELFNVGLLGEVKRSDVGPQLVQRFRRPFEFEWKRGEILKEEATYLIHPSLIKPINEGRQSFFVNPINPVGSNRSWLIPEGRSNAISRLFISHAATDKPLVEQILGTLEQQLHLTYPTDIWFDKWAIPAGGNIHQEVEKGVVGSDLVILMVSQASLTSGWVDAEWRRKHHEEISTKQMSLICLIIDETRPESLPEFLHMKRAVRLAEIQSEKGLESFCLDLSQVLHQHLVSIASKLHGHSSGLLRSMGGNVYKTEVRLPKPLEDSRSASVLL